MTVVLLVAAALVGQGSNSRFQDSSSVVRSRSAPVERGFLDFQRELSDLFRQEATATDNAARAGAIRGLCELHRKLVSDSRYSTSDTLKEYRARIWSRLTKVKAELKREFGRDAAEKLTLADAAALESADALSAVAADSLATSLSLSGQAQGGPGYLLAGGSGITGAFGGPAGTGDYGPELVTLIERTINPAFWDVVGGPGSVVYYQPLQCLVVRATSEIHGNLGGLLGGLRAVGP
jgi:hypothetical protein